MHADAIPGRVVEKIRSIDEHLARRGGRVIEVHGHVNRRCATTKLSNMNTLNVLPTGGERQADAQQNGVSACNLKRDSGQLKNVGNRNADERVVCVLERMCVGSTGLNVVKIERRVWSVPCNVLSFEGERCVEHVTNCDELVSECLERCAALAEFVEVSDAFVESITPRLHGGIERDLFRRRDRGHLGLLVRLRMRDEHALRLAQRPQSDINHDEAGNELQFLQPDSEILDRGSEMKLFGYQVHRSNCH